MSDRFVRGWKVSPEKLQALVGKKQLEAKAVLESRANEESLEEVVMTLGDESEEEGTKIAGDALAAIMGGELNSDDAYAYGRVTELLLNHIAKPLAADDEIVMELTYHVPGAEFGCWNPLLKALKLRRLAKTWARGNFAFPWAKGKPRSDWPAWTLIAGDDLEVVAAELEPLTRKQLDALPVALLAHDEADAAETRDELWEGLKTLRKWVKTARRDEKKERLGVAIQGNALVLLMDGDQ
ncbi:hypothetical protein [Nannocystis sp. SCPEA4]|uniref:hypothetical protein n=1 Tax=Nannocystis sp. SCPEA4 TaxID=2996787 RepID=UPI00226EDC70|nr:hypothetical protein [Nannocystis sp. SCPEA4]MCY1062751.1 hypothetical protein [Nannocystis sp. SCPEA4]